MAQRCLFLDPGVLLNFCILEEGAEVLAALPYRTLITSAMSSATYSFERDAGVIKYSAEPLIAQGILGVADLREEHASEQFIELACLGLRGTLGGLAALASMRGGMMATDDEATINLMTSILPEVPLLTTAALIHEYSVLANPSPSHVEHLVSRLQEEAVFTPSRGDPFLDWWQRHLKEMKS